MSVMVCVCWMRAPRRAARRKFTTLAAARNGLRRRCSAARAMVGWPPLRPDSARCALYGFRRGAPASRSALAAARQQQMLRAVWPLLNTGGELLYSTCSVFPEEGEAQARAFERAASDAVRLPA